MYKLFLIIILLLIFFTTIIVNKDGFDEFINNAKNKELIDKYYAKDGIKTRAQLLEKLEENGVNISQRTLTNYLTKLKV